MSNSSPPDSRVLGRFSNTAYCEGCLAARCDSCPVGAMVVGDSMRADVPACQHSKLSAAAVSLGAQEDKSVLVAAGEPSYISLFKVWRRPPHPPDCPHICPISQAFKV